MELCQIVEGFRIYINHNMDIEKVFIKSVLCLEVKIIQLQKLDGFDDKATPQLKTSRHSHQLSLSLSLWLQLTSSLPNAVSARAVELSVKEVA